jgi:hypothetical protein
LPTPRAKEKAKAELIDLEAKIDMLDSQSADLAATVTDYYRQVTDLRQAIHAVGEAMRSESGERALRARAEAVRSTLASISCEFVPTGKSGRGGPHHNKSRLVAVTFNPISGDQLRYKAGDVVLVCGTDSTPWPTPRTA